MNIINKKLFTSATMELQRMVGSHRRATTTTTATAAAAAAAPPGGSFIFIHYRILT